MFVVIKVQITSTRKDITRNKVLTVIWLEVSKGVRPQYWHPHWARGGGTWTRGNDVDPTTELWSLAMVVSQMAGTSSQYHSRTPVKVPLAQEWFVLKVHQLGCWGRWSVFLWRCKGRRWCSGRGRNDVSAKHTFRTWLPSGRWDVGRQVGPTCPFSLPIPEWNNTFTVIWSGWFISFHCFSNSWRKVYIFEHKRCPDLSLIFIEDDEQDNIVLFFYLQLRYFVTTSTNMTTPKRLCHPWALNSTRSCLAGRKLNAQSIIRRRNLLKNIVSGVTQFFKSSFKWVKSLAQFRIRHKVDFNVNSALQKY